MGLLYLYLFIYLNDAGRNFDSCLCSVICDRLRAAVEKMLSAMRRGPVAVAESDMFSVTSGRTGNDLQFGTDKIITIY